jgi:hypothetical protein
MISKLKVAIDKHLTSMLDLHGDLTYKQARDILGLRIRHQLPKIDKDEINEWLKINEQTKVEKIVSEFKVGDKVRRIVPFEGSIIWTITHITSIGELVIEVDGDSSGIVSPTEYKLVV